MPSPDSRLPPNAAEPQTNPGSDGHGHAERGLHRLWAARERILGRLRQAYPSALLDLLETAFTDTVLELCENPGELDPLTVPWSLVYFRAWRRARALVRSERFRRGREAQWAAERRQEVPPRDLTAERRALAQAEVIAHARDLLLDEKMRITFDLWAADERQTAVYAEALGLEALSVAEQRRTVKRERDRLRVFLRRHPAIREVVGKIFGG